MQRNGEHVSGMRSTNFAGKRGIHRRRIESRCSGGRQKRARRSCPGKNCRSAVALMHVAIDGHCGTNLVVPLHPPDGDCHIVNYAEAFAVVREGMMKAATNADA